MIFFFPAKTSPGSKLCVEYIAKAVPSPIEWEGWSMIKSKQLIFNEKRGNIKRPDVLKRTGQMKIGGWLTSPLRLKTGGKGKNRLAFLDFPFKYQTIIRTCKTTATWGVNLPPEPFAVP